jgi:hypothetical protein
VSEALYRMWTAGVSVVTWFTLRDQSPTESYYQAGLYYEGASMASGKPKPILAAFRFPFVGFAQNSHVYVWGRVPPGSNGRVVVEQSLGHGWKKLGVLRTNASGIFSQLFATGPGSFVRARALTSGVTAPRFPLKPIPDRFYNPFGLPTLLEPVKKK